MDYCGSEYHLNKTSFGETKVQERDLKITIPENLEYAGLFDDIFATYTQKHYSRWYP